jgi:hypothetical protein
MRFFVDESNKRCFILAPKCGNQTISHYLKLDLHIKYTPEYINEILTSDTYLKLIIIRKNIYARFLSGFYEDLFNNTCYSNVNMTFSEYLLFLKYGFDNKIKKLDNLNCYDASLDVPIWFGNCSKLTLPITNEKGIFQSHISSQKYSISKLISSIKGKNAKLIELDKLSNYLDTDVIKNKTQNKTQNQYTGNVNTFTRNISLKDMKQNRWVITHNVLNDDEKSIIHHMYKEDIEFINNIEHKFEYIT